MTTHRCEAAGVSLYIRKVRDARAQEAGMKTIVIAALLFASPLAIAQDVVPQAPVYGGVVPVPPTPIPAPSALPSPPPDFQLTPPPTPLGVSPVPGFPGQPMVGRPTLNTFTEQQIRTKLLANGYSNISGLSVDGSGTWHGTAVKDGGNVGVMIDSNGAIHP
jgi:hypothetical protein